MNDNLAIEVENLTKIYKLYDKPEDRLKEVFSPVRKMYHKDYYAINDISFSVKKGETVGIIGKNGSGKSTLLKIITGVLTPTAGNTQVNGEVSALLELGAGFNPLYTGIENIYLNGTIKGYSKEHMDSKMEDILSFADIGDYVNQPVRTYSSGMFVRLAFSVAINIDPEVLIVDEALSVGDIRFQQKCWRKIEEFNQNKTVLFVTHDMGVINKFCKRVIWLDQGRICDEGHPENIAKKYQAYMLGSQLYNYKPISESKIDELSDKLNFENKELDVLGDNKATIVGVALLDSQMNQPLPILFPQEEVNLLIRVKYNNILNDIIIGFSIKDRLGNIVLQSNSYVLNKAIPNCIDGQIKTYCFKFTMPPLNNGIYTISPAIATGVMENHVQHSWVHDVVIFEIISDRKYNLPGYLYLDNIDFSCI